MFKKNPEIQTYLSNNKNANIFNIPIDTLKKIERKDSDGTSIVTKEELTEILGVLLDTIRKQEEEKRRERKEGSG